MTAHEEPKNKICIREHTEAIAFLSTSILDGSLRIH